MTHVLMKNPCAVAAAGHAFAPPKPRVPDPLVKPVVMRTTLKVGGPSDALEREAGRVADETMRKPAPRAGADERARDPIGRARVRETVQRKCTACEADEVRAARVSRTSTRAFAASAPSVTPTMQAGIERSRSAGGRALSGDVRTFFEQRLQRQLPDVRIHADAGAAELASELKARAFTVGHDVFFADGEYRPALRSGQHLLAHELVHTLQDSGGVQAKFDVGARRDELEAEADTVVGEHAEAGASSPAAGGAAGVSQERERNRLQRWALRVTEPTRNGGPSVIENWTTRERSGKPIAFRGFRIRRANEALALATQGELALDAGRLEKLKAFLTVPFGDEKPITVSGSLHFATTQAREHVAAGAFKGPFTSLAAAAKDFDRAWNWAHRQTRGYAREFCTYVVEIPGESSYFYKSPPVGGDLDTCSHRMNGSAAVADGIPFWVVADFHTHGSTDCPDDSEGALAGGVCDYEDFSCKDVRNARDVVRSNGAFAIQFLFTPEGKTVRWDPNAESDPPCTPVR